VVAVCPNNNEVHIYQASPSPTSAWECIHVLQKVSLHILLVLPPPLGTMYSLFLFGIVLEKGPQTDGQLDACIIVRWWDF